MNVRSGCEPRGYDSRRVRALYGWAEGEAVRLDNIQQAAPARFRGFLR